MKLLLSLSSLVVLLQITSSVAQSEPCVTGHSYFDGCNQCTCLGAIYACTEKDCRNAPVEGISNIQKREVSADKSEPCVVGHTYQDDCNSCFCTNTGIYACTLRACYHGPQFPDTPVENSEVPTKTKRELEPCVDGHSYLRDCNTCTCSGGRYACTLRGCSKPPQVVNNNPTAAEVKTIKVKRAALSEPCTEGHSYYDGCNTCRCLKGGRYACTLMYCFQESEVSETTENIPSEHVKSHDGGNHVDDSSAKVKREVDSRSEPCVEGHSYEEDCNTCRCTNTGVYACTRRACYHGPQFPDTPEMHTQTKRQTSEHPEPCVEGHSYEEDCNTCRCTNTGVYACTRRACYHGPQFPDTPETHTQTKRQTSGCDKGDCPGKQPPKRATREIEAVTGKYDMPRSNQLDHLRFAAESCTPYEVKNEQCNRCKCTKNGKGWICTRKVCPDPKR